MSVSPPRHNIAYVMSICSVAALGGLLLGYDSSVISGTIEPLSHHFHLSPAETGWAVSNVIFGCVIGCLIAGHIADRYGRKKTLLLSAGSWGAAICLIFTFIAFYSGVKGVASVLGLFGFILIFGVTWAQVVWTVIGEIFPNRLRAAGMGFSISAMWIANFFVSQRFPMMNENAWLTAHFGGGFPLLIFAVCCLISWWFVRSYLPETKGVALEKMEQLVLARFAPANRADAPRNVQPDEKTS